MHEALDASSFRCRPGARWGLAWTCWPSTRCAQTPGPAALPVIPRTPATIRCARPCRPSNYCVRKIWSLLAKPMPTGVSKVQLLPVPATRERPAHSRCCWRTSGVCDRLARQCSSACWTRASRLQRSLRIKVTVCWTTTSTSCECKPHKFMDFTLLSSAHVVAYTAKVCAEIVLLFSFLSLDYTTRTYIIHILILTPATRLLSPKYTHSRSDLCLECRVTCVACHLRGEGLTAAPGRAVRAAREQARALASVSAAQTGTRRVAPPPAPAAAPTVRC